MKTNYNKFIITKLAKTKIKSFLISRVDNGQNLERVSNSIYELCKTFMQKNNLGFSSKIISFPKAF